MPCVVTHANGRNLLSHGRPTLIQVCQANFQFCHIDSCEALSTTRGLFDGDLEVAHVGNYAHELKAAGMSEGKADEPNHFSTFTMPIGGYDRAKCDGDKDGFVRIHVGSGGALLHCSAVL